MFGRPDSRPQLVVETTITATSDRDTELALSRANAAFNQCYFVDVNAFGPWGGGRSAIFDPNGRVLQQCGRGQAVLTEIDGYDSYEAAVAAHAPMLDFDLVRATRRNGTLGMCQTWKQLRDTNAPQPMYDDLGSGEIFKSLGELEVPGSAQDE